MSASRSMAWTITNATSAVWTLTSSDLLHGVWSDNPPKSVPSGKTISFKAESNGFMTGCEGTVAYTSDDGEFVFYFDNPFIGGDSYSVTTPHGFDHKTNQQTGTQYVLTSRCFKA